jgi:phosphoribosylformimino-5-aminoimidazole carboxamide ribotide isomerase
MKLLPAIDLVGGRCVRLQQGDFDRETSYSHNPLAALQAFADAGAEEAHLVDLDGAKARAPRQHDLFVSLAKESSLDLQVAGGFRDADQVARVLDAGCARVVIGSLALDAPDGFSDMLDRFGPQRITLALDVRLDSDRPMVAAHGWAMQSNVTLDDVMARFPSVHHVLVTDISRDGMLSGPNLDLMRALRRDYPDIALQASGGVAGLDDLAALRDCGAARVIVGKAIWERRFTVAEGLAHARG